MIKIHKYAHYCNVAKTDETFKKGNQVEIANEYGYPHIYQIHNFLEVYKGLNLYSIKRPDLVWKEEHNFMLNNPKSLEFYKQEVEKYETILKTGYGIRRRLDGLKNTLKLAHRLWG